MSGKSKEDKLPDLDVLSDEGENAKERLSKQHETLREFSQEGMNMFRLLLLFVAAPAAILGALSPEGLQRLGEVLLANECAIGTAQMCLSTNWLSIFTGGLFVFAAGMNIVASGYEARAIHKITNPEDVVDTITLKPSLRDYRERQLTNAVKRIHHNNRVISVMEQFLTFGKIFLYLGAFTTGTLAYIILSRSSIPAIHWIIALVVYFLPLGYYIRKTPTDYRRADNVSTSPLYDREKVKRFIEDREKKQEANKSDTKD